MEALLFVPAFIWVAALLWALLSVPPPEVCRGCGYDLQGRPDTPRCPECGLVRPQWC